MATFKLLSRLVLLAVLGGVSAVGFSDSVPLFGEQEQNNIGSVEKRRVITSPDEFAAVGFLRTRQDQNKFGVWLTRGNCTATVIANKAVLFARHCIPDIEINGDISNGDVAFFPAFRGDPNDEDLEEWRGISITHILIYESKNAQGALDRYVRENSNDFAIGLLDKGIAEYTKEKGNSFPKIAPVKILSTREIQTNTEIILPSYSTFKSNNDRQLFSIHENCHILKSYKWDDKYGAEDGQAGSTLNFSELAFDHDCYATGGSSGAPLLVKRGDTYYIMGVHVGYNPNKIRSHIQNSNFALGVYTIFHDLLPFKYPKISWSKIFSE